MNLGGISCRHHASMAGRLSLEFVCCLCLLVLIGLSGIVAQDPTPPPANDPTNAPANGAGGGEPPTVAPTVTPVETNLPVQSHLNGICLNDTNCVDHNTACVDDGYNSGNKRCRCIVNYIAFDQHYNGTWECGLVVTTSSNINCQTCEKNEGRCIDFNTADAAVSPREIFCQCPISRSGKDCEVIHVNVTCTRAFMTICYAPHAWVNFSASWEMFAQGHSDTPRCKGVPATGGSNSTCAAGNEVLDLSLNSTDMKDCGTVNKTDVTNLKFSNTISISMPGSGSSNTSFNVYCSFQKYLDQTYSGIGVVSVNGNDRGAQVYPMLSLLVRNAFGAELAVGANIIVGDQTRFLIQLVRDTYYDTLTVTRCTASTSDIIPDSEAETKALIANGCPIYGVDNADSWYWTVDYASTSYYRIKTGLVPMFKLSASNVVYLHCNVKLCLVGDDSCPLYNQSYCSSRSKRSLEHQEENFVEVRHKRATNPNANVTTQLKVSDQNNYPVIGGNAMTAVIAILSIVVVGIIIIVVIGIVMQFRKRKGGNKNGDGSSHLRPQMFSLPRIRNTHQRF